MDDARDHSVRIASLDDELNFYTACPRLATPEPERERERRHAWRARAHDSSEVSWRGRESRLRSRDNQELPISGKKLRFDEVRRFDRGERSGAVPFAPRMDARRGRDDARPRYIDGSSEGSDDDEERENSNPKYELKRMSLRGRERGEKLLHLSPIRESNKRATSATYAEIRALQARHNDILTSMGTLLEKLQALQLKN